MNNPPPPNIQQNIQQSTLKNTSPEKSSEKNWEKNPEKSSEKIPEAYRLSEKAFYDNIFFVDDTVLIPRPETEIMVDIALALMIDIHNTNTNASTITLPALHKAIPSLPCSILSEIPTHILDCGTGSGCIGISILAELYKNPLYINIVDHNIVNKNIVDHDIVDNDIPKKNPQWTLSMSDVSEGALCLAQKNMKHLVPTELISYEPILYEPILYEVVQSNLLEYFLFEDKPDIGIILANLPYVAPHHLKMLSLAYEPRLALEGTLTHHTTQHNFSDGLEIIHTLFEQTAHFTHRHIIILEADPLQMDSLSSLSSRHGYTIQGTLRDFSHYPRIFYCIR